MTLRKLKYKPTVHAVERMREYFGTKEIHAVDFANDLMANAKFVMMQPGKDGKTPTRVFKNDERDVMIVVDEKRDKIITILPPAGEGKRNSGITPLNQSPVAPVNPHNAIIAAAHETIKRELTKARRIFTTELRRLKIEQAELGVEIAQAAVNKVRCKAPHTQALIQERIDAMQAYHDVVGAKIAKEQAEYSRVKTEAQAFIGEVSV